MCAKYNTISYIFPHCIAENAPCQNGEVQLDSEDKTIGQGTVEICYGNQWGTICDSEWDESEAEVICRQLKFNNGEGESTSRAYCGR